MSKGRTLARGGSERELEEERVDSTVKEAGSMEVEEGRQEEPP